MLDRLAAQHDIVVQRTDEQGAIEFVSEGRRVWGQTEQ
jgi:hypothetical protein